MIIKNDATNLQKKKRNINKIARNDLRGYLVAEDFKQMNDFLSTLKREVNATKEARLQMKQTKQKAENEFQQVVESAHEVVGHEIPVRMNTLSRTRERSVSEVSPPPTEKLHVSFDESTFRPPPPKPRRKPTVPRDTIRVKKKNYITEISE